MDVQVIRAVLDLPLSLESPLDASQGYSLLRTAQKHRVVGLVAHHVKRLSDPTTEPAKISTGILIRNRVLHEVFEKELQRITSHFDNRGITCILLKGNDFARGLYDDPTERDVGDIDLLVQQKDLLAAESCLRELSYEDRLSKDPIWTDDPDIKRAYRLRYSHDPIEMQMQTDMPIIPQFLVELHQPVNFKGLGIDAILKRSIARAVDNVKSGYHGLCATDSFLMASWHIFHHAVSLPDRPWPYPVRMKQCRDWWLAYKRVADSCHLGGLFKRIVETDAAPQVTFSAQKMLELFHHIEVSPPARLVDFTKSVRDHLDSDHTGLERLLDSEWRYGDFSTSFWSLNLNPKATIESIKNQVSFGELNMNMTYEAHRCGQRNPSIVSMREPDYQHGSDRLVSYVYQNYGVVSGIPNISWSLSWDEEALFFSASLESRETIKDDFEALPPRYADKISLYFASDADLKTKGFHVFTFALHPKGVSVFTMSPTVGRLAVDVTARYLPPGKVEIVGALPHDLLPFQLSAGTRFAFRLRYVDHLTQECINTVLSWPGGALNAGEILLCE